MRGFTLLELLVVLLLMTIVFAATPPLLSGIGLTTELRGAARQLAAGLRLARNEAVTQQQAEALTVDVEQRRFSVAGKTRNLPDDDDVTIRLYTAQSELLDGTRGNIRFFPDGSSTGGYIALADAKVEYRVKVDWVTGHISIETRNAED